MAPERRRLLAFVAASLQRGRPFTHVYDHDGGGQAPVGGIVRPERVDVIDGDGLTLSGKPEALFCAASGSHLQLVLEDGGFGGYDYASERHFKGVFGEGGAVQLFDHETGRYHAFHVS